MNINFKKLDEFEIFEKQLQIKIFDRISKMETMLNKNDLQYFGVEVKKNVEEIFTVDSTINIDGPIGSKIHNVSQLQIIPTNVLSGLHYLKNIANRETHSSYKKSDKEFEVIFTLEEAKVALRNLWLFIKWIGIGIIEIEELKGVKYQEDMLGNFYNNVQREDLSNSNNDMQAEKMTLSQLIFSKDYVFNIPTYQRDYTWEKKNVTKLMNDIIERTTDGKTHYFGSLAIAVENDNILRIIDGQQRITTTLIIIKALYDDFIRREVRMPSELSEFIKLKIKNIYVSQDVLSVQKSVSMLFAGGVYTPEYNKIPFNNLELIKNKLLELDDEAFLQFYTTFITKLEVATLVFKTSIDNEMDIFENLNTGGTELKSWDLIRSYIFSRISPKEFRLNEKEIDRLLLSTFLFPLNVETDNNSLKPLSDFFVIYTRYKYAMLKKNVWKDEAYIGFKNIWPQSKTKYSSVAEFQKGIGEIKEVFNCYLELKYLYKKNSSALHGYSHIINLVNRDDVMPIFIHIMLKTCSFNIKGTLKSISPQLLLSLRTIETYFMRAPVYGNNQKNIVDKFMSESLDPKKDNLFHFLKEQSSLKMMTLEEFENHIGSFGSWNTSQILNLITHIEFKLRKIKQGSTGYTRMEKTHEHILAQKLKYSDYQDSNISEEQFIAMRDSRKNSMGNALLLALGDNSRAGNKPFIIKKDVYKNSSISAKGWSDNIDHIMNLLEKKEFTFDDINKRAEQMARFIVKHKIYYDENT
ncbi:DUF262 domain-containing protein [Candidatus Mycoplasma mahonii]|uniref:DUF262 domain-containing protein n=1 Tax=Candidatus Mycoplasma mahonii TaxID=3004105 RepID=UPI0026EE5E3F|nr:DUF262 domain-containing HNH endonuclease family protein [Candidatus Mycoplasma mahonii]WKX02772.1 DUF262 domain-containing HNH endonuclease family protein [Candidatus Mycoplasma mahonii]